MAPVLRPRGEAGDANPSNRGHLPVRGIRHYMSSSEGEEEPRLTPVRVAMGPASVMARRALREQQQQAVQEEEDGRGRGQDRERDDGDRDQDRVRRDRDRDLDRVRRDRDRDQDRVRREKKQVQVAQETRRETSFPGGCTPSPSRT